MKAIRLQSKSTIDSEIMENPNFPMELDPDSGACGKRKRGEIEDSGGEIPVFGCRGDGIVEIVYVGGEIAKIDSGGGSAEEKKTEFEDRYGVSESDSGGSSEKKTSKVDEFESDSGGSSEKKTRKVDEFESDSGGSSGGR